MEKVRIAFCAAVADDALMLARLHAAELDASTWRALRETGFPEGLGLLPARAEHAAAWDSMREALKWLSTDWNESLATTLASDFASIYLNNRFRANPHASAHLDEDGLLFQNAMFDLRRLYRQHGWSALSWRRMSEDHLAAQLQFTAVLARQSFPSWQTEQAAWQEWGEALEVYLLSWIQRFAQRIAERAEAPFYPALAALTWAWTETLRDHIAMLWQAPRLTPEVLKQRLEQVSKSSSGSACVA